MFLALLVSFVVPVPMTTTQEDFPFGVYTAELQGRKWEITLSGEMTYEVKRDGVIGVKGTFTIEKKQITMTDVEGAAATKDGKGVYEWSFADGKMTFKKVADPSLGRAAVLTAGPWTKAK